MFPSGRSDSSTEGIVGSRRPAAGGAMLALRRLAGGTLLLLVLGLSTCQGLWFAATGGASPTPTPGQADNGADPGA